MKLQILDIKKLGSSQVKVMSKYNKYITSENIGKYDRWTVIDITTDEFIKEWSDSNKLADINFIQSRISDLLGKVLTVIDASIPEGKQNKCIKDLIRKDFMHEHEELTNLLIDKNELKEMIDGADESEIQSVTLKEALGA